MGWMDEYQQVDDRLREFHDRFRAGRVITDMVSTNHQTNPGDVIIFRAELFRGDELRDVPPAATGYAHQRILEKPPPGRDGKPNLHSPEWTSPWETCETSAIGRALANMGFSPKGKRPSFEEIHQADVAAMTSPVPHASPAAASAATAENEATRASTGDRSGGGVTPPSESTSEGVSAVVTDGSVGDTTVAPPSDALAALLEAVGGSEVKAINAINKASHTAYKKAELETLEPEDWEAGLRQVRGNQ